MGIYVDPVIVCKINCYNECVSVSILDPDVARPGWRLATQAAADWRLVRLYASALCTAIEARLAGARSHGYQD
jgi:hypothetical protein